MNLETKLRNNGLKPIIGRSSSLLQNQMVLHAVPSEIKLHAGKLNDPLFNLRLEVIAKYRFNFEYVRRPSGLTALDESKVNELTINNVE